jgi:hypothetical protein
VVVRERLPPSDAPAERVRALCLGTLSSNWTTGSRAGVHFAYTRPSPERYRWQWYWDSCFSAIVWRRLDAQRSRLELSTLLAAQREDGFIGHTIFWEGRVCGVRRLYYNVIEEGDFTTATIQPPMLAWAWRIAVGDPAQEPAIAAHHDYIVRERDLEGDGLVWLIQPDESGMDASPQFDPIWRHRAHGLPGFLELVHRNRKLGFRISAVRAAGGPIVCEVLTNVLHGLSQLALGRRSVTPALIERLYDERSGLFLPQAWPPSTERIPLVWSALAPLALPDLPEGDRQAARGRASALRPLLDHGFTAVGGHRLAELLAARTLRWRASLLARTDMGQQRMAAWLGLVRLGYRAEADKLADGIGQAVVASALREFYDPYDGRGMGARAFAWSALALELLEPDPAARTSQLCGS